MRKRFLTLALTFVVCALLSPVAFANVKTRSVTFRTDVKVGDTVVKKGTYKVKFDDQSNELTILDGKKVIAKTTARLEDEKSTGNYETKYTTDKDDAGNFMLSSVNMGGKHAVTSSSQTAGSPASTGQKP